MIKDSQILNSISYCGLICHLCHGAKECAGCKSKNNCCGAHMSGDGCFQYNCCIEKGIQGCWECSIAPCDKGMFSHQHDIRNSTFVKVAKEEGLEKLARYVAKNQNNGILYGWNKDYDNLGTEEAVIDLLHNGTTSKYFKKKE